MSPIAGSDLLSAVTGSIITFLSFIAGGIPLSTIADDGPSYIVISNVFSFLSPFAGGGFLPAFASDGPSFLSFITSDSSFSLSSIAGGDFLSLIANNLSFSLFFITNSGLLFTVTNGDALSNVLPPLSRPAIFFCISHYFLTSLPTLPAPFISLYSRKKKFDQVFIT